MFTNEDYERLLVKYTSVSKSQELRVKGQVFRKSMKAMKTDNDDNNQMANSELKEVILDLFEQVRQANARNAEKDRANAEKDRMIASLTNKLDAVLENQRQQKLDLETWLAKERWWNKEREELLKTIKGLNDIVKVLKKGIINH